MKKLVSQICLVIIIFAVYCPIFASLPPISSKLKQRIETLKLLKEYHSNFIDILPFLSITQLKQLSEKQTEYLEKLRTNLTVAELPQTKFFLQLEIAATKKRQNEITKQLSMKEEEKEA